ncbi:MAG: hypothetical protein COB41_00605 [Proteobacteria bacterium]|nr:MAG: hypothetical protein COB41_00605 [Pseudomonadota bacterium]
MAKKVAKKKKVKQLAKKELTETAFSVIINDKGTYDLVTLKFHSGTKQAYVEKIEKFAVEHYQAMFEFEKLLANDIIIPVKRR